MKRLLILCITFLYFLTGMGVFHVSAHDVDTLIDDCGHESMHVSISSIPDCIFTDQDDHIYTSTSKSQKTKTKKPGKYIYTGYDDRLIYHSQSVFYEVLYTKTYNIYTNEVGDMGYEYNKIIKKIE